MTSYGLTRSQICKLCMLANFLEDPEKFGCHIDKGDPETYQERAGRIIADGIGVVDDINNPPN